MSDELVEAVAADVHAAWIEPVSDEPTYPPLVMVEWTDTTNIAAWTDLADIADWAPSGGFMVRNVGYLVHEDDDCVVLAARVALGAEPRQVGLFERVPKGVITRRTDLRAALAGDGDTAERPDRFTCPLCAQLIECRITVTTGDDPADEAVLRMNLRVDEEPLRTHVKEAHS